MKKLLILALLIASVTFVFAVESNFSDVVGYVKYELNANDYNMIALPMDSGITTTAQLAAAISPDITSISTWDGGWVQYSTANAGTSFEINEGDAFLIYLGGTTNVDFYCAGTLPTQANYDVAANDYSMIMLPLNRSEISNTLDLAAAIGVGVTSISTWNGGWVQYSTANSGTSFNINIGDGFLMFSNAAYNGWNLPAGRTTTRTSVRK